MGRKTFERGGVVVSMLVVLLLVSTAYFVTPTSRAVHPKLAPLQVEFDQHIQHIVILVMENHAFDNEFGVYCPTAGPYCSTPVNGLPNGTCVPEHPPNATPCIKPYSQSQVVITRALPHSGVASMGSYANGTNDGFYTAEHAGKAPFGYYNGSTVPIYWDLAEEYGLGDAFFSSTLSYSLPNHWHLVAGTQPAAILTKLRVQNGTTYFNREAYLNQANQTQTIQDLLLNASNVSWKYYDHHLGYNYSKAIGNLSKLGPVSPAFGFWDPMASKAETYNASFEPHFVNKTSFFADASTGRLPNISYLIPPQVDSDHPPANESVAQGYVASVVDAVESSPEWNSTALFITFDEYGGFYDHVIPPIANGTTQRLGFRVPLMVVSPWAREGYVDNNTTYFESILRLAEDTFNLGCLTADDCSAPTLYDYFNFSSGVPRAPLIFPTTMGGFAGASYPIPLQPLNGTTGSPPKFTVPAQYDDAYDGGLPDVD
jgi:phospholipase C